jgi:hypothetical protein
MSEERLVSETDGYNLMTRSRGRARPDSGEGIQWVRVRVYWQEVRSSL